MFNRFNMKVRLPTSKSTAATAPSLQFLLLPSFRTSNSSRRSFISISSSRSNTSPSQPAFKTSNPSPTPNPTHWLSNTKTRLGKLILFGLTPSQTRVCGKILQLLSTEWRSLVAGREGFLTSRQRAGLIRHKVVWGEMDVMGHVNNVTYTRYAESARINWVGNFARFGGEGERGGREEGWKRLWTSWGTGLILRSIRTDYKFPMTWPDHISVFHKLRQPPSEPNSDSTSFILDVLIVSELHQRPAARCIEDIVVYDYKAGKKMEVPSFMREGFERIWKEQERERRRVEGLIVDVDRMVRQLELETWDREGAVEDMGGEGR